MGRFGRPLPVYGLQSGQQVPHRCKTGILPADMQDLRSLWLSVSTATM